jgi:hypothetical protein
MAGLATAARAAALPLTIGAYYYAWYGPNGLPWTPGALRPGLDPPELPLLGEYDSRAPAVIAQHYAWAQEYGVDVFFCSWHGPGGYDDVTIRDRLLPSPARGPTKIALLYESLQRLGIGPDARIQLTDASVATMVSDFDYIARTYFADPGYYRIDGRPVVIVYASRIFRGDVAGLIHAVRAHLIDTYGIDPYLIGDEVDWDNPPDPARIALFDAITGYTLYSRTQQSGLPSQTGWLERIGERVRQFRRVAAAEGVGFVPGSLPGFDSRAIRPGSDEWVLPRTLGPLSSQNSLFAATLALAGGLVDPALRLLTVTSWNEWYEDTQIEPTADGAPLATGLGELAQGYAFAPYGLSLLELLQQFKAGWEGAAPGSRALAAATRPAAV